CSKRKVFDDFNNTLTSTRSVSSIGSTTSGSSKYNKSSQVNQSSSFDTFDFCYALLSKH
ncbi:unnamed protein product, partial [Rotaria magnacalcarata]